MFEQHIQDLKKEKLLREVLSRFSSAGPLIILGGKRYINFASNDYLGLAAHSDVVSAAVSAVKDYGFGSGASRLLAGGTVLHDRLERQIARFKQTAAARIFNSGYAANTGVIPALSSAEDLIFSDELNHASIIDGCRLSRAKTVVYRHCDMTHLAKLMRQRCRGRKIVVTDTVFSMDGDLAPLPALCRICSENGALLYLDDAHGTGVLGKGKGALAHFGIRPEPWLVQMGTFSKAFGSFGAFVAGAEDIVTWTTNAARSLIFSTALPAAAAAASLAALSIIRNNPRLIESVWLARSRIVRGLEALGYDTMQSVTPIIPVRMDTVQDALNLSRFLFRGGVYAPAIRPPTVREPRIRITASAAHTHVHIERLLELVKKWDKRR